MLLNINSKNPQPRLIEHAVKILRKGGIIAYPTDTIYGFGCDIMNKKAIKKIHKIKQQPLSKPFSFICPGFSELSQYAQITNYAYKNLKRLLPGPYTFILKGSRKVPKIMLTKRREVGIRIVDHPIVENIVQKLNRPLLSTSATDLLGNYYLEAWKIEDKFNKLLDLIIDGGPVPGEPSSVISLIDDIPKIIRKGAGTIKDFI